MCYNFFVFIIHNLNITYVNSQNICNYLNNQFYFILNETLQIVNTITDSLFTKIYKRIEFKCLPYITNTNNLTNVCIFL